MIRTLFIIAGAALVLCVAALAGAAALGGHDMARNGWAWTFKEEDGEHVRIERVRGDAVEDLGPVVTRTLEWTGGDRLTLASSLDVEYVQGPAASVVVTGPQSLADRVRLEDGRLYLDDGEERVTFGWVSGHFSARSDRDGLKVVVTAPDVRRFDLSGSGDLSITGYDQPSLSVAVAGSGEVTATGRAPSVEVRIAGSGDVDLSGVAARSAQVEIAGSGDARLAPADSADIAIAGSGDVRLATRPATVNQRVSGSGDVIQE